MGPVSSSKKILSKNKKTKNHHIVHIQAKRTVERSKWELDNSGHGDNRFFQERERNLFQKKKPDLRVCTMASARVPFFKHKQMYNVHQPSNTVIQLKYLKAECGRMVMRKYYFKKPHCSKTFSKDNQIHSFN